MGFIPIRTVEMAKKFPQVRVVGLDLTPCPIEKNQIPVNCSFEIGDINLGLSQFENQFDVVHVRFVSIGLKNFARTMKDVHSCLKPGGIVLWLDAEVNLYFTEEFKYVPPASESNPQGSWYQRPIAGKVASLL
jgi:trans-aconitate methyltransferase